MLDNLILAYRAQVYDWSFSQWKAFYKKNKLIVISSVIFILMIIISIIAYVRLKSWIPMLVILFCEAIIAISFDRYSIKNYRKFLVNKQNRLDKTVAFLKTAMPGENLFNAEQIEELTEQLSKCIELKIPFRNFLMKLNKFTKSIVLPIITYVAGVYSGNWAQINFVDVVSFAVGAVFWLGVAYFLFDCVFAFLRITTCRNYDAAIALREDLIDIKLLYFTKTKKIDLVFSD